MSYNITEEVLFQKCVYEPIQLQIQELNLKKSEQQIQKNNGNDQAANNTEKDALRLIYRSWSGITKYIKQVCYVQNRPIELPGIGVLMPKYNEMQQIKLTESALSQIEDKPQEIILVVNDAFLNDNNFTISKNSYNIQRQEQQDSQELFIKKLQKVNFGQIAKVCDTDQQSIEAIHKEIQAQIHQLLKKGQNLKIDYRIGKLEFKNGEVIWNPKQSDDFERVNKTFSKQTKDRHSQYQKTQSKSRQMSMTIDDSVMTPSFKTLAQSQFKSYENSPEIKFHSSNPNPQNANSIFKGARQVGYQKYFEQTDPYKFIKFGKKIDYSKNQLSNDQIMQDHLKQIKEKMQEYQSHLSSQKQKERELIDKIQQIEKLEKEKKEVQKNLLLEDFKTQNEMLKQIKLERVNLQDQFRQADKYDHFPFVGSDQIEKQRKEIKSQLNDDLKSYLNYKSTASKSQISKADSHFQRQAFSDLDQLHDSSQKSQIHNLGNIVKNFYDSSYVRPFENFRVFQDTHPNRAAVTEDAFKRYQDSLNLKQELHNEDLEYHQQKINKNEQQWEQEFYNKINKQKEFKHMILQQMQRNRKKNEIEQKNLKESIYHPYGPVQTEQQTIFYNDLKKKNQSMIKQALTQQIDQLSEKKSVTKQNEMNQNRNEHSKSMIDYQQKKEKKKDISLIFRQYFERELDKAIRLKNQVPKNIDFVLK